MVSIVIWEGFRKGVEGWGRELGDVEEQITLYGETLSEFTLDLSAASAEAIEHYRRALDAYEAAKRALSRSVDVEAASLAVVDGRSELELVRTLMAGPAAREESCFFNPAHGASVVRVRWRPDGGSSRWVAVCAADAARLASARERAVPKPPEAHRKEAAKMPAAERAVPRQRGASRMPVSGMGADEVGAFGSYQGEGDSKITFRGPLDGAVLLRIESLDGPITVGPRSILTSERTALYGGTKAGTARVPVPRSWRGRMKMHVLAQGRWRIVVEKAAPREFVERVDGRGADVVAYTGPGAPARFTHRGRGSAQVHALTPGFETDGILASAKGDAAVDFVFTGPAVLAVHARGVWSITLQEDGG
ncbi:hypothetical protein [Actinomadura sp. WMMA1423]|uniref:hypothetical protein n=1 Tax=Actinomadura sp. WMMA1423 TaxID=2591108 RepID=UPI001147046E|nr:hypothetical protein [Actinomadura sp. WMMA1423]